MINPRSVATQGVGFSPLALSSQGFVTGIFVQLGGFGQTIAFGLPTISIEAGALEIQVPSLGMLLGFGLPSASGGTPRPERLFVRLASSIWSLVTRGVWRE